MSVDRSALSGLEPKVPSPILPLLAPQDATLTPKSPHPILDGAKLKPHEAKPDPLTTYGDAPGHEGGGHDLLSDVAHKVHSPHGAMHAVEAGEHALAPVARLAGRLLRSGASAAEAQSAAHAAELAAQGANHALHEHHGVVAKVEKRVGNAFSKLGSWLGKGIRRMPGGEKAMAGASKLWQRTGKAVGPGLDHALQGTQLGKAASFTGSGGRFVGAMGGRVPILGAFLGSVIAVVDCRDAMKTLRDPKQSPKEKMLAAAQGAFSVTSGLLGMGALGAAGAVAIGLSAPVSIPALMLAAAVTGVVSFGISFFRGGASSEKKGKAAH